MLWSLLHYGFFFPFQRNTAILILWLNCKPRISQIQYLQMMQIYECSSRQTYKPGLDQRQNSDRESYPADPLHPQVIFKPRFLTTPCNVHSLTNLLGIPYSHKYRTNLSWGTSSLHKIMQTQIKLISTSNTIVGKVTLTVAWLLPDLVWCKNGRSQGIFMRNSHSIQMVWKTEKHPVSCSSMSKKCLEDKDEMARLVQADSKTTVSHITTLYNLVNRKASFTSRFIII